MSELLKTPQQIIVDRINAENNSKLTVNQLLFDIPVATGGTPNTRVRVTAKPFSGIVGTVELNYNRIDLATILTPDRGKFYLKQEAAEETSSGDYTKLSDIIGAINDLYQINLTNLDYIDVPLVKPDLSQHQFKIVLEVQAAEEALIYYGTGRITLAYRPDFYDTDLSKVITHPYLDGFKLNDLVV